MADDSFDKDFGYLMPFLDRILGFAASLPESAARAELSSLVDGERARWLRIRELITGGRSLEAIHSEAGGPIEKPANDTAPPRPEYQLTVGSLRPKSKPDSRR